MNGIQEVRGSIPLISTTNDPKQNASGRSFLLETAHSSAKNPIKMGGIFCSYGIYMESTRIVSAPVGLLASKMHTFRVLLSKRRPPKQKIFKPIYMHNSQIFKNSSARYCLLTVCWFVYRALHDWNDLFMLFRKTELLLFDPEWEILTLDGQQFITHQKFRRLRCGRLHLMINDCQRNFFTCYRDVVIRFCILDDYSIAAVRRQRKIDAASWNFTVCIFVASRII